MSAPTPGTGPGNANILCQAQVGVHVCLDARVFCMCFTHNLATQHGYTSTWARCRISALEGPVPGVGFEIEVSIPRLLGLRRGYHAHRDIQCAGPLFHAGDIQLTWPEGEDMPYKYIDTYTYTCTHTYTHAHAYTYTYICTCTCTCAHTPTYTHPHTQTHTHTKTHTHTNTHTHTTHTSTNTNTFTNTHKDEHKHERRHTHIGA
jgi:hypothetical protein